EAQAHGRSRDAHQLAGPGHDHGPGSRVPGPPPQRQPERRGSHPGSRRGPSGAHRAQGCAQHPRHGLRQSRGRGQRHRLRGPGQRRSLRHHRHPPPLRRPGAGLRHLHPARLPGDPPGLRRGRRDPRWEVRGLERRLRRGRAGVHHPPGRGDDRHLHRQLRGRRLQRLQGHGRRRGRGARLHPAGHQGPQARDQHRGRRAGDPWRGGPRLRAGAFHHRQPVRPRSHQAAADLHGGDDQEGRVRRDPVPSRPSGEVPQRRHQVAHPRLRERQRPGRSRPPAAGHRPRQGPVRHRAVGVHPGVSRAVAPRVRAAVEEDPGRPAPDHSSHRHGRQGRRCSGARDASAVRFRGPERPLGVAGRIGDRIARDADRDRDPHARGDRAGRGRGRGERPVRV
ncbi:MAG: Cell envelope-associated transcriptional attenuator LytR-CpsA-Psr, subfamily A1, partial [uncultured Nocardioides sp.]